MSKHSRRAVSGHVYDRFGRIIEGLIDNGRLILIIGMFLSVGFMVRSLEDLAAAGDDKEAGKDVPALHAGDSTQMSPAEETRDRVAHRSDFRIKLHRECADEDYRMRNRERCEQLDEEVEAAIENHLKDEGQKRDFIQDGDTRQQESAPVLIARAS